MEIENIESLAALTTDAALIRLYAYWRERRGAKRFPARSDIDPVDFSFALGRVSLVDVLNAPRRFRFRLVATILTEHLGYEMTGKFLDQVPQIETRAYTERLYATALERRNPLYARDEIVLDGRRWKHEVLVLPLSSDDRSIDMLMIYRVTDRPRRAKGDTS
jgi:hypothetical protein